MKRRLACLAAFAVIALSRCTPAYADALPVQARGPACGPAAAIEAGLAQAFGETLAWSGNVKSSSHKLQVYRNPTTHTWTMLLRDGDRSCIIAAGEGEEAPGAKRPAPVPNIVPKPSSTGGDGIDVIQIHGDFDWINKGKYRSAAGELCCGMDDCYEVPASRVQQTPEGYSLPDHNVVVPGKQAIPSEDGKYWICKVGARWRCFFAPLNAF